jgi:hypothetical protein
MPLFAPPESTGPDASGPTALWWLGAATTVVRLFADRMVVRLFADRMVRLFAGRAVVQRLFAGEINRSLRAELPCRWSHLPSEINSEHEAAVNSAGSISLGCRGRKLHQLLGGDAERRHG